MTAITHVAAGLTALFLGFTPLSSPGDLSFMHTTSSLHKAEATGDWLATGVRSFEEGDRLHGNAFRQFIDPNDFEGGEKEVKALIDAIDYLEIEKPEKDKLILTTYLHGEKDVKRKFKSETGKTVKVELRHQKTRLIIQRLSDHKVILKVRGIGASYGGLPIPESTMRMILNKERLELIEIVGFDIDQNTPLTLPKVFQAEDSSI